MKFLRHTAIALALGAAVMAGACVDQGTGSDSQNTTEVSERLMEQTSVAPGEFSIA